MEPARRNGNAQFMATAPHENKANGHYLLQCRDIERFAIDQSLRRGRFAPALPSQ
jgi:hypothetical protein